MPIIPGLLKLGQGIVNSRPLGDIKFQDGFRSIRILWLKIKANKQTQNGSVEMTRCVKALASNLAI